MTIILLERCVLLRSVKNKVITTSAFITISSITALHRPDCRQTHNGYQNSLRASFEP